MRIPKNVDELREKMRLNKSCITVCKYDIVFCMRVAALHRDTGIVLEASPSSICEAAGGRREGSA